MEPTKQHLFRELVLQKLKGEATRHRSIEKSVYMLVGE